MNQQKNTESENAPVAAARPPGWSCSSCLFALVTSWFFIQFGTLFAAALVHFKSPPVYALAATGIFLFGFVWQFRAARRGCFMPVFILAAFIASQSVILCMVVYDTGEYKKFDFSPIRIVFQKHAPGLLEYGQKAWKSGFGLSGNAASSVDERIAELEETFRRHPGSPDAVLALADAYMERGNLASARLAASLYEALAETAPCDTFLARLADAYARMLRYDLAFQVAVRRTWLPEGGFGKAARQIAWLAASSGDISRGIFELERMLRADPADPEEIMLLLAGLYTDAGNTTQARALLDRVIAETPAALSAAKTAAGMRQALGN